MKNLWTIFILLLFSGSLLSQPAQARELTERERNIYTEYKDLFNERVGDQITEPEFESRTNSLLEKYNTTEDEVLEIYYYEAEGLSRLTQKEQEIADDFDKKAAPIRAESKSKQDQMRQDLINEYGLSVEEFDDISTNYYYVKLYLVYVYGEDNLPAENKETYLTYKEMMEDFSDRMGIITDEQDKALNSLREDLAAKYNTTTENIINIAYRESLGLVYKE